MNQTKKIINNILGDKLTVIYLLFRGFFEFVTFLFTAALLFVVCKFLPMKYMVIYTVLLSLTTHFLVTGTSSSSSALRLPADVEVDIVTQEVRIQSKYVQNIVLVGGNVRDSECFGWE